MNVIKNVLLFIWQLPQNILGFLVWSILSRQGPSYLPYKDKKYKFYITDMNKIGVSLGNYIIVSRQYINLTRIHYLRFTIKHEYGHQRQSKYLGPLYLIVIGLPSFLFNIWDRLFHKKWDSNKRVVWYYKLPWEHWANKLGNIRIVSKDVNGSLTTNYYLD